MHLPNCSFVMKRCGVCNYTPAPFNCAGCTAEINSKFYNQEVDCLVKRGKRPVLAIDIAHSQRCPQKKIDYLDRHNLPMVEVCAKEILLIKDDPARTLDTTMIQEVTLDNLIQDRSTCEACRLLIRNKSVENVAAKKRALDEEWNDLMEVTFGMESVNVSAPTSVPNKRQKFQSDFIIKRYWDSKDPDEKQMYLDASRECM
jgi:hypothetical protein